MPRIIYLLTNMIMVLLLAVSAYGGNEKNIITGQAKYEARLYDGIANNDVKEVKALLKENIDINLKYSIRDKGSTPLIEAIYYNNTDIARLLIEKDADINYRWMTGKDDNGRGYVTALYFAIIELNYDNTELLLDKGAQPNFIIGVNDVSGLEVINNLIGKGIYFNSSKGNEPITMDPGAIEKANAIKKILKKYSKQ